MAEANLEKIALLFGNGDRVAGKRLLAALAVRLFEERRAEPLFAEGPWHALGKIGQCYEAFRAEVTNSEQDPRATAGVLASRLIRFLNGEHSQEKP